MNSDLIIEDLYHSCNGLQFTIIYFVQVTEGPALCVQRCEAQAKSNNNKPAARVAQSSQDRQEGSTGS